MGVGAVLWDGSLALAAYLTRQPLHRYVGLRCVYVPHYAGSPHTENVQVPRAGCWRWTGWFDPRSAGWQSVHHG